MNTDLSNNISSDEEEVNAAKKKRVHFTEFQLSGLNHAYGRTKGRPTAQLMEKLAENFDLEQHQVSEFKIAFSWRYKVKASRDLARIYREYKSQND